MALNGENMLTKEECEELASEACPYGRINCERTPCDEHCPNEAQPYSAVAPERVELWDAIHAYARSSYAGAELPPSDARMTAVSRVTRAVEDGMFALLNREQRANDASVPSVSEAPDGRIPRSEVLFCTKWYGYIAKIHEDARALGKRYFEWNDTLYKVNGSGWTVMGLVSERVTVSEVQRASEAKPCWYRRPVFDGVYVCEKDAGHVARGEAHRTRLQRSNDATKSSLPRARLAIRKAFDAEDAQAMLGHLNEAVALVTGSNTDG